jgi:GABA(A) receptor-associated protein
MCFKEQHGYNERQKQYNYIINKYPKKIPIICEKNYNIKDIPDIDKNKYIVSPNITIGQLIHIIRKRIKIDKSHTLYFFINNIIPSSNQLLYQLYNMHKDNDGFLYITYTLENTFG